MDELTTLHAQYERWLSQRDHRLRRLDSPQQSTAGQPRLHRLSFEEFCVWWHQVCSVPAVRERWLLRFAAVDAAANQPPHRGQAA